MSIFISIASYRDNHITNTIKSIYSNASEPERIFCGVFLQIEDEDIKETFENVRVLKTHYKNAKGPLWARQTILKKLYNGEDYYLQIDSHTIFKKNWDTTILNDLKYTYFPQMSIISFYPPSFNNICLTLIPHMCSKTAYERFPDIDKYEAIYKKSNGIPQKIPYLAAGFLFGHKNILQFYPNEEIEYLFQGEEMLLVERMAKGGVEFYAPTNNLCGHLYYRNNEPKIWFDIEKWDEKEFNAITQLLSILRNGKKTL